jgi:hypothetical protein
MTQSNNSALVPLRKAEKMLLEAKTIDEILHVENLAQRARDFAKAAGMGRDTWNAAARIMLDARRRAGDTLKLMKQRGELAERGDATSQRGRSSLADLGLTYNQSSRYQKEASVPQEQFQQWVSRVIESEDGDLTAAGVRALSRQQCDSNRDESEIVFSTAANRIRLVVEKLWELMGDDAKECLSPFLRTLADEYEGVGHG